MKICNYGWYMKNKHPRLDLDSGYTGKMYPIFVRHKRDFYWSQGYNTIPKNIRNASQYWDFPTN